MQGVTITAPSNQDIKTSIDRRSYSLGKDIQGLRRQVIQAAALKKRRAMDLDLRAVFVGITYGFGGQARPPPIVRASRLSTSRPTRAAWPDVEPSGGWRTSPAAKRVPKPRRLRQPAL